jgi:hypothetical protein
MRAAGCAALFLQQYRFFITQSAMLILTPHPLSDILHIRAMLIPFSYI